MRSSLRCSEKTSAEVATMCSMLIREAIPADAETLAVLSAQLGYPVDVVTIAQRLEDIAAHAAGVVRVAADAQGAVCGFANAEPRRLLIADPFVELTALVVAQTARGAGTGAALLAAVEAWARDNGFTSVRVRSNVLRERAHRFYLREGYIERKRQAVFLKRL
ncbi:MAG: GNAT family N-acetyltransferase [Rhodanobacteraceae bacterium]|nr:MAG: GNAT family N-acetyltransferase [Rhodanobacteraceae bacterium]